MTNSDYTDKNEDFSSVRYSVKHKQIQRKIRKKRKRINSTKAFMRFLVVLGLLFISYRFVQLSGWYLPQDTYTKPEKNRIEIINNKIIPTHIINKNLSKIQVQKIPIFMMSTTPLQKELYKIPVIKAVYIRRYAFPARIQIIITERVPNAIIKANYTGKPIAFYTTDNVLITNKQYMNINDNSSILKILTNPKNLEKELTVKKFLELEKIVKDVERYSNQKVEYIDIRKPNDVYVKIKTTSIRLGTLDSTVFDRIKRIYTILPQITDKDNLIQYIDLSWDKVNYLKLKKQD